MADQGEPYPARGMYPSVLPGYSDHEPTMRRRPVDPMRTSLNLTVQRAQVQYGGGARYQIPDTTNPIREERDPRIDPMITRLLSDRHLTYMKMICLIILNLARQGSVILHAVRDVEWSFVMSDKTNLLYAIYEICRHYHDKIKTLIPFYAYQKGLLNEDPCKEMTYRVFDIILTFLVEDRLTKAMKSSNKVKLTENAVERFDTYIQSLNNVVYNTLIHFKTKVGERNVVNSSVNIWKEIMGPLDTQIIMAGVHIKKIYKPGDQLTTQPTIQINIMDVLDAKKCLDTD